MHATAERLRAVIEAWAPRLAALDGDARPAPDAWSTRELVGHLVDSASVNLERFLRARGTDHLDLPGYPQDAWVQAGRYAEAPYDELVELWRLLNLQVARVVAGTPEEDATRSRARHALDRIAFVVVPREEPTTLAYLMDDYVVHLEHHLAAL